MDYSTGIFSDFGSFLKMNEIRKIEVGINSNLLHSIRRSICIRMVKIPSILTGFCFMSTSMYKRLHSIAYKS